MKKLILALLLTISLTGCVSPAVRSALESVEDHITLKWAGEWKPALQNELDETIDEARQQLLAQAVAQIDGLETKMEGKLETIGVKIDNFDTNQDGRISGGETLALLQEIKSKNDESPNPLSWWEIMLALGAAYIPTTAAKEALKSKMSKMSGTGDGSQPV